MYTEIFKPTIFVFICRPRKQGSSHSSLQVASTSSSSASNPNPTHLPTNEFLPSNTPSTNGAVLAPSSSSLSNTAPESIALTRPDLTERSLTRDDLSETVSTASTQGCPVQHEHSYALTFSSTAEEIPFLRPLEATPNAPPISSTHDRDTTSNAPPLSRSNEASPTAPPTSDTTTTLNAHLPGSIPVSVIQSSLARGTTRERNSNVHATSRTGLPHHIMLSSFGGTAQVEFAQTRANVHTSVLPAVHGVSVLTEHAQNDGAGSINGGGLSQSNPTASSTSNNPLAALFEVPLPVTLANYPMGSDVQRTTNVNNSLAEQRARERERLEQSTAFITSHAQDRNSSRRTSGRRRGRRRDHEQTETQSVNGVRERSSNRRHTRDRSPINNSQHALPLSSLQATRQRGDGNRESRRDRQRPVLATEPPIPPPNSVHVPVSSTTSLARSDNVSTSDHGPQYVGYQIVPQGQPSSGAGSSSSGAALSRPPLPRMHLSQRRVGMPVASNAHPRASSFHGVSGQPGTSSSSSSNEPVLQLSSPHSDLRIPMHVLSVPESHSGTILYPLPTSRMPSTSHSHVPFHPTASPHIIQGTPGGPSSIPIAIIDSPQQIGEPTIIVDSPADHEVPRLSREIGVGVSRNSGVSSRNSGGADNGERRESLVEVIVVDSSDSEHEVSQ